MRPLTVLTLSGSLRKASLNTAMLRMAADCAPMGLQLCLHSGLSDLPLFNPDLELHEPQSVQSLRAKLASADALLIASPEYAHGVSGAMKNALDWMVGSGVFADKPVVLWNASPRATHALAALRETLNVLSARLLDEAGLEMLIRSPEAGAPPLNPDPPAMRRSLLVLRNILCAERLAAGASEAAVTHAAS